MPLPCGRDNEVAPRTPVVQLHEGNPYHQQEIPHSTTRPGKAHDTLASPQRLTDSQSYPRALHHDSSVDFRPRAPPEGPPTATSTRSSSRCPTCLSPKAHIQVAREAAAARTSTAFRRSTP